MAPRRPLIYRILFEGFLFSTLFIAFHVLEKVITGLIQGKDAAASVPAIGGGGLEGLASVALIMFVMLIPFFAFKNVSRELGRGRVKRWCSEEARTFPARLPSLLLWGRRRVLASHVYKARFISQDVHELPSSAGGFNQLRDARIRYCRSVISRMRSRLQKAKPSLSTGLRL